MEEEGQIRIHVGAPSRAHNKAREKAESLLKQKQSIQTALNQRWLRFMFPLLVDESRDVSTKAKIAIVLHYIDKWGRVMERFFGLIHIIDTNALALLAAIEAMLVKHGLSLSNLRGQGYDGASNMRGEFMDLKSLY